MEDKKQSIAWLAEEIFKQIMAKETCKHAVSEVDTRYYARLAFDAAKIFVEVKEQENETF